MDSSDSMMALPCSAGVVHVDLSEITELTGTAAGDLMNQSASLPAGKVDKETEVPDESRNSKVQNPISLHPRAAVHGLFAMTRMTGARKNSVSADGASSALSPRQGNVRAATKRRKGLMGPGKKGSQDHGDRRSAGTSAETAQLVKTQMDLANEALTLELLNFTLPLPRGAEDAKAAASRSAMLREVRKPRIRACMAVPAL